MTILDASDLAAVRQEKEINRIKSLLDTLASSRIHGGSLGNTINTYLALPALRAFYPMSGHGDAAGKLTDMSGNAKHLTRSGTPRFFNDGLAPSMHYELLNSAYHYHADDYSFDISGTETFVSSGIRGLTLGAWCYPDTLPAGINPLIVKESGAGNYSYRLSVTSAGRGSMWISSDGALVNVDTRLNTDLVIPTGEWSLVIGRWSTSYTAAFVDNNFSNTASTQASIYNSNSQFKIGNYTTNYWNGKISMAFVCASYLSDDMLTNLWLTSKALFHK